MGGREGLGAKNLVVCLRKRGRPRRGAATITAVGGPGRSRRGARVRRNKRAGGRGKGRRRALRGKLGGEMETREGLVLGARGTSRRRTVLQIQTNQVLSPTGKSFGEGLTTNLGVGSNLLMTRGNKRRGTALGRDLGHSSSLLGAVEASFPKIVQLSLLLGIDAAVGQIASGSVEKVERELRRKVQRRRTRRKRSRRRKGGGRKIKRRIFPKRRRAGHLGRRERTSGNHPGLVMGLLLLLVISDL